MRPGIIPFVPEPSRPKRRALLVEDEAAIREVVRFHLDLAGLEVTEVGDGRRALDLGRTTRFDLILLDVMLPGVDGITLCRAFRESGANTATPILMLTAKDGDLDEAEALETGADDYLTKPFSFPVLVARIRALLRRSTGRSPIPVEVGDLRIDPGQRRAWRAGVEVNLTSRQFDVLEFLLRRAGQVLSKAEILNGVWEYDFAGDPNIVEVYIRRLRTRIDEPFGRRTIETVRGSGYRLATNGK